MAKLYASFEPKSTYWDKKTCRSQAHWEQKLSTSTTVYVGNLSFYTTEDQVYELFSKCGAVRLVVMGLNSKKKVPCGFAFVQFDTHEAAAQAVELLNHTHCDERTVRVDWDTGEGVDTEMRKFGRSVYGTQWRDFFREGYDPGRGEGLGVDYADWNRRSRAALQRKRELRDMEAHGPYMRFNPKRGGPHPQMGGPMILGMPPAPPMGHHHHHHTGGFPPPHGEPMGGGFADRRRRGDRRNQWRNPPEVK